jgi:hypothetical protein
VCIGADLAAVQAGVACCRGDLHGAGL